MLTIRNTFLLLLSSFLMTSVVQAQFTWERENPNYKVLPDSTTPQQLRSTMIGFVQALGVRCVHCHDDAKGTNLNQIDFAADTKVTKETARLMMRMVKNLREVYLSQVDRGDAAPVAVTCITCHRGQAKPRMLEDVLAEVIEQDGIEAGLEQYHALRDRYYGGFTFDFSEGVLNNLGYRLIGGENLDDAFEVFKLNVEMYPEGWNAHDSLAETYMNKGMKAEAITHYEKSLALNPRNRNGAKMLEKLKQMED